MTHAELKTLARLASEAAAALIPLAADARGRNHHGEDLLPQRGRIVARALNTLEHAGRLATEYRRRARRGVQAEGAPHPRASQGISSGWADNG